MISKVKPDDYTPEQKLTITNFYFGGETSDLEVPDDKVCARLVVSNLKENSRNCFVKQSGSQLYDPNLAKTSFSYRKQLWKFRRVPDEVFNLYLQYLGYNSPDTMGRLAVKLRAERML